MQKFEKINRIIKNVSFSEKKQQNHSIHELAARSFYGLATGSFSQIMQPAHRSDSNKLISLDDIMLNFRHSKYSPLSTPINTPSNTPRNEVIPYISEGLIGQNFTNVIYLELNTYSFDKHKLTIILTCETNNSQTSNNVIIYRTVDKIYPTKNNIEYIINFLMYKQDKEKSNPSVPFFWYNDFNDEIKGNIINNKLVFSQ